MIQWNRYMLVPLVIGGLIAVGVMIGQAPPPVTPTLPPRQLRGCQVPAGAQGAVYISIPGTIGATCATIGTGFVLATDPTTGKVTLNPAASTTVMQTIGTTIGASTPNSFPLPAGATHLMMVFLNLGQLPCVFNTPNVCTPPANAGYTFTNGLVVFTQPLEIGDTVIIEGW